MKNSFYFFLYLLFFFILFSTLVVIALGAPAATNNGKLTGGSEMIFIDPVIVAMEQKSDNGEQATEHNYEHENDGHYDHSIKMDSNQDEEDKEAATVEGEEALRTKRQYYDHSHCYHDHCHDYYSDGHSHVRWGNYGGWGRRRWGYRNWGWGR